jgi:ABC-type protease/lipase transport system fused ATPase/permease subunit
VARRWLIGGSIWAVLTVLVFLLLNPILAAFITIVTATVVVVLGLAANWEDHSTFEQREAVRAVKRKEKWDRNKDVRERDRARWEAHQAQQARKAKP